MSIELNLNGVTSPYMQHYMGEWAMDDRAFDAQLAHLEQMNLSLHVQQQKDQVDEARDSSSTAAQPRYGFEMSADGIATVQISGVMMKVESSMMESTSTVMMRRTLRSLAADPSVKAVMMAIDSPGGTVAGTDELAADINALKAVKPVGAYIGGVGASAAYLIASQANEITASPMSDVGSIGTMLVVYDYSKKQEQSGVKIHVLKTGEFKGQGVPGTPVDQKMLDELQRRIDGKQKFFTQSVADGRGVDLKKANEWADGRVHVAGDAQKMGLIDHVGTMDAAMEQLRKRISSTSSFTRQGRNGVSMSATSATTAGSAAATEPTTQQGATPPAQTVTVPATAAPVPGALLRTQSMADRVSEIEQACPGAPSDFVIAQVKADASIETAQREFIKTLNTTLATQKTERAADAAKMTALQSEVDGLKAKLGTAQANSVNQPAAQAPAGQTAVVNQGDPVAVAKAEWAANKDDCQNRFMSEDVYVSARKHEMRKAKR